MFLKRTYGPPLFRATMRILFVLAGLNFLPSMALAAENGDETQLVKVDAVRRAPLKQRFPVIGRLVAQKIGEVSARTSGPVAKINVDVGDRVEKDQIVAVLVNDTHYWQRELRKAQALEAKAALKTARAQIKFNKQELKRLEKLQTSAAFSQARFEDKRQEVVQAESAAAQAEAAVLSAEATLKLAEIDLYVTDIRAPYGGVVTKRHTEVGAFVALGDPVVSLIDNDHLEIEADVPAERISGLIPGTVVSFTLSGNGSRDEKTLNATVRAVVPQEDPLSRTRIVRFTPNLQTLPENTASGQSVTVSVPMGKSRDILSVHKDALLIRKNKNVVFIVKPDMTVELRQIKLGETAGGRFEVLEGLRAGEITVVRGNERLRPGQTVRTTAPQDIAR